MMPYKQNRRSPSHQYKFTDPDGRSPVDLAFLTYDLGKLGVALWTGVGVPAAAMDVAWSAIGTVSPIPGVGQAIKTARAVDRSVDVARAADKTADAASSARRTKKVEPIKDADGPHTTWKTDPKTGEITRHETWTPNSRNPKGWDSVQSTDLKGRPHVNSKTGEPVPTPHTQGKGIEGGLRPAEPSEIPKNQRHY